jgi:hypothetical protein
VLHVLLLLLLLLLRRCRLRGRRRRRGAALGVAALGALFGAAPFTRCRCVASSLLLLLFFFFFLLLFFDSLHSQLRRPRRPLAPLRAHAAATRRRRRARIRTRRARGARRAFAAPRRSQRLADLQRHLRPQRGGVRGAGGPLPQVGHQPHRKRFRVRALVSAVPQETVRQPQPPGARVHADGDQLLQRRQRRRAAGRAGSGRGGGRGGGVAFIRRLCFRVCRVCRCGSGCGCGAALAPRRHGGVPVLHGGGHGAQEGRLVRVRQRGVGEQASHEKQELPVCGRNRPRERVAQLGRAQRQPHGRQRQRRGQRLLLRRLLRLLCRRRRVAVRRWRGSGHVASRRRGR